MAHRKKITLLICSLWLYAAAWPAISAESKAFQPIVKKILPNGLTLINQRDESSEITVLYLFIRGGKKVEPWEKRGLAYLTSRLTIEIPDQKKAQDLMSQASQVSMSSRADYSYIRIACLSESLEDTLKTMSKIITDPLLSGIRIDYVKKTMESQKKREDDDSLLLAHEAHINAFLAGTGYGGSVLGSEESRRNIRKRDVEDFFKAYYRGSNMILTVCSNLDEKRVLTICSDHFAEFPDGVPPPIKNSSPPVENERDIFIEKEGKQAVVSFGFPLPSLTKRHFALAYSLETLLGKGIGSRLWPLRAEEKLAYNFGARSTQLKEGGVIEVFLETDNTKREEALKALEKTIDRLLEQGVTEEELRTTKVQSQASFLRANETKETRAFNLGLFEVQGLGFEFLNEFFQEIEGITVEDMNFYIQKTLDPEKRVQVVVGSKNEETEKNKPLPLVQTESSTSRPSLRKCIS